jgi:hypothetical protein
LILFERRLIRAEGRALVDKGNLAANSRKLKPGIAAGTAPQIGSGMNFPAAKLIEIFEPDQWEDFTEEWAHTQEKTYKEVMRYTGAGDMGLDILCFRTARQFEGAWDNVQCKRYACKLQPAQVWVELGKIIYYSFAGKYPAPANYFFAASKGLGLRLKKLLTYPDDLKKELIGNWDIHCKFGITDTKEIPLEGKLLTHLHKFDFRIFKMIPVAKTIKDYYNSPFYIRRFGTANLPARPAVDLPPDTVQAHESRYVQQLFEAYSEKLSLQLDSPAHLAAHPELERHFNRSREIFYHAESLRSFARDSVDPGTFDDVCEEIYHGVVNTYEMPYTNGFTRMAHTLQQAGGITPTCNALCIRVQTQDKQGICHHLANDDRFKWVKKND